jgi:glycosyltransferase involved in cell wall biosynthesis
MVVLEAWAHRLPVILTPACHLPEGPAAGAALAAESQPASLADAMETLFAMTAAERARMGDRGHHLVAERFNWTSIGAQMHHVCQWLLGQAGRPDCVLPETRNLHAPRPLEGAPA